MVPETLRINQRPEEIEAWQQREYQRASASVYAEGIRPERRQPDMAQRRRSPDEQPPEKDPRLENTRRSYGRRIRSLQINWCT